MKSINPESLTIGELAKLTDVHVETIRYYQRRDLLEEPERNGGRPHAFHRYQPQLFGNLNTSGGNNAKSGE